ncbi:hypothetical protein [Aureimonas pseudogalii]|uniref:Uncharacterized protein n=1 Tax=Aureimonas pseudogalii TaxID=1744844 RepID=A0A7W6EBM6_9HYPH|nr:hypothetical protein [Aureimonas pseudogalii]MBB3998376.1 hypothetical protein [Aureimonas pseudogalii]
MSATYNSAVREGWRRAAAEIREPLRRQMQENLGSAGILDSWMSRMLENNVDRSSRDPDEPALRRVGSDR